MEKSLIDKSKDHLNKETAFSVRPDQVEKEIQRCPIQARNNRLILMPFVPPKQTDSGILVVQPFVPELKVGDAKRDDLRITEPSADKIPLGWVVSRGPEVDPEIKIGDLVSYAGFIHVIHLNRKEYLSIWGNTDVIGVIDRSKIECYW